MSIPCEAGCGRYFQRQSSMTCHLSSAQSCQWYLLKKFRSWDEDEGINTFPPHDTDYGGIFEEDDNDTTNDITNIHSVISQLQLGPQDTVFIPHITANLTTHNEPDDTTGDAGPGPETAANRLRRAALCSHILDDEGDERITVAHKDAGVVRRKESPPVLSLKDNDKDGDTVMDGPDQSSSHFHPFNSELDWKIAQWATRDGPGQNALDRLLSVPGVCSCNLLLLLLLNEHQVVEKLGLSYHNVRAMHKKIDAMRDPIEAIKGLWQDPNLSPHMAFAPSKVYTDATKSDRIYSEMWTGQWWHVLQVVIHVDADNNL